MNDRYLFKAKGQTDGKWHIGLLAEVREGVCTIYESARFCWICDPETLCQCTGLKDRDGTLIWENDVLNGNNKRGAAFSKCLVLWNECKARYDVRAMGCNFPMTLDECTDDISICGLDYEVLGNIFDNPELLEVGE